MKKVQNLSKYVKTHKLISLGVAASTVALVATGIGTYSYFKDAVSTTKGTVTLNSGTVKLSDFSDQTWTYLENTTEDLDNLTVPTESNNFYSGKTVNTSLNNGNNPLSENAGTAFKNTDFTNIVPGDTFEKSYDIKYTGSNEAEIFFNFDLGWLKEHSDSTEYYSFANTYDYRVEYSVTQDSSSTTQSQTASTTVHSLLSSDNSKLYSGYDSNGNVDANNQIKSEDSVKKGGTIHLKFFVRLKDKDYFQTAKDDTTLLQSKLPNISRLADNFTVSVQNKLETKKP